MLQEKRMLFNTSQLILKYVANKTKTVTHLPINFKNVDHKAVGVKTFCEVAHPNVPTVLQHTNSACSLDFPSNGAQQRNDENDCQNDIGRDSFSVQVDCRQSPRLAAQQNNRVNNNNQRRCLARQW